MRISGREDPSLAQKLALSSSMGNPFVSKTVVHRFPSTIPRPLPACEQNEHEVPWVTHNNGYRLNYSMRCRLITTHIEPFFLFLSGILLSSAVACNNRPERFLVLVNSLEIYNPNPHRDDLDRKRFRPSVTQRSQDKPVPSLDRSTFVAEPRTNFPSIIESSR